MSPIEVAHSLPTGAAVATVAAEGYDLGSEVRTWPISRGVTDHYAVEAGSRRYVLRLYPTHWRTRADVLFELELIRHAAARVGRSRATRLPAPGCIASRPTPASTFSAATRAKRT